MADSYISKILLSHLRKEIVILYNIYIVYLFILPIVNIFYEFFQLIAKQLSDFWFVLFLLIYERAPNLFLPSFLTLFF